MLQQVPIKPTSLSFDTTLSGNAQATQTSLDTKQYTNFNFDI